jgi:pSer/pThr/pTyr-binding forkhead associated (FHA) protein
MKAKLFCKTGILSGKSIEFGESATIGQGAENDLELNSPFISNKQARIYFDKKESCYFLEDLRSRNGTRLDGMKVTQKEKLGSLHVITFPNNFDFIFQVIDAGNAPKMESVSARSAAERRPEKTPDVDADAAIQEEREKPLFGPPTGRTILDHEVIAFPSLTDLEKQLSDDRPNRDVKRTIPDELPAVTPVSRSDKNAAASTTNRRTPPTPLTFELEVRIAGNETQTFRLREGENLIGRSQQCFICIDDSSLSRQHALMTNRAGKVILRDLESKNHTYLDKKLITTEAEVRPEMKIRFGTIEARLVKR